MALKGLHHIHLRVPDLPAMRRFVTDFGFELAAEQGERLYFRGAGTAAYLLVLERAERASLAGLAFEVDSAGELQAATAAHGATPPRALDGPGGGNAVTLRDPGGTLVHLVHGIAQRAPDPAHYTLQLNQGAAKPRLGGAQTQVPLGPPRLLRLGHVGLFVKDAETCGAWYQRVLGLLASDLAYAGTVDHTVAAFYRVDRGAEWVDHHTVALFGFGKTDLHHVSFEVENFEAQFIGHRWLRERGYESIWGVGRHPRGSHVFDVWRDPAGYRFETFSDTDVLNASHVAETLPVETLPMDLWTNRSFEPYFA